MGFEAVYLPDAQFRDPADRWMVAAARVLSAPLVTSDRAILAYVEKGYVDAIRP